MALIPYEPFRHLDNMRRELDRFFTTGFPFNPGTETEMGMPRIDVHETENEVVATCDLPGLEKKDDVHIDVDENRLTISGTINRVQEEVKEDRVHRRERYTGHFQRTLSLPAMVNADEVKATYKNGVLEVRMPKAKPDTKRRIDVEFH
ncbi:MAG: Hsp20/alpha crystallin family protein [Bacillaceae bacterium]|nr:Hsp20/alpha crystallin family protein [Bacillaceae bacterium]